ncbi:PQQ-binding-like beta-propeller repeat protein [bacterium]|nr:PQQ-binding-like beta-propeller repeat protein [bacterium]
MTRKVFVLIELFFLLSCANNLRVGELMNPPSSCPGFFSLRDTLSVGKLKLGYSLSSPPAVLGNLAFFGTNQKRIVVVDLLSGKIVKRFWFGTTITVSPSVSDSFIVVAGMGDWNQLSAYSLLDGKRLWEKETETPVVSSRIIGRDVFVLLRNGKLFQISISDGKIKGRLRFEGLFTGAPIYTGKNLVVHSVSGDVYSVPITPEIETKSKVRLASKPSGDPVLLDSLIVFPMKDGSLLFLDKNLNQVNRFSLPSGSSWGFPVAVVEHNDLFLVSTRDGSILAIDPAGDVLWQSSFEDVFFSPAAVFGDFVLAGGARGSLYNIDINTGELIWEKQISSPVVGKPFGCCGRVFVPTEDGQIFLFPGFDFSE